MSRLLDPKRSPSGKFPFDYTPAPSTNVRATWDRLDPGWRDRKPGESKPEPRITNIRKQASQR